MRRSDVDRDDEEEYKRLNRRSAELHKQNEVLQLHLLRIAQDRLVEGNYGSVAQIIQSLIDSIVFFRSEGEYDG